MHQFRTGIFEKTTEKIRKRIAYNLFLAGSVIGIWVLFLIDFPIVDLKTAISFSGASIAWKLYDDHYMGISAYGERKDTLVIAEQYLEVRDVRIFYADVSNLVIYVDEYLGMPRNLFGIHHGGNNKIEFHHKGRAVSLNYVIKNKHDFQSVNLLVDRIEKNPDFQDNLKKL